MRWDHFRIENETELTVAAFVVTGEGGLRSGFGRRHGILAAAAPRMTAPDPLERQPGPGQRPVAGDGLERIRGATRRKPALAQGPKNKRLRRRYAPAIYPHTQSQNELSSIQASNDLAHFNNPAFRIVVKKSFSTSA